MECVWISRNFTNMSTITLQVPDTIDLDVKDTIKFLSAKLYESGKLSLGQAADLAGLSKIAFAEIIGDYNVSLINHPVTDILRDASRI
jgi:predicted HTH domain antitoxin